MDSKLEKEKNGWSFSDKGVDGKAEVDGTLTRVLEQRDRHRERSLFVRSGVAVAGGAVSLSAALLAVVTPEFGLPLLLFGLRLLALEFDWAARLYAKVAKLAKKAAGGLRRLFPESRRGVAMAVLVLVVALGLVFTLLL